MVIAAHRRLLVRHPDCLLLLVPRHPERAVEVMKLCQQAGMSTALYSDFVRADLPERANRVLVVDVLGELAYLYGLAPVALIGGSLVAHGGHNPLEALQAGCAVLSGVSTGNFADIYRRLEDAGAVTRVENEAALAVAAGLFFNNSQLQQRQVAAGSHTLKGNRGALDRILEQVCQSARPGLPPGQVSGGG
jgi:3-deoxy-D-manno-octulosonic-acid transferase